uniref:Uncharacterized protein n=1 Tax=Anopheles albimanus TaxID=7167 RepID=A0A2C9GGU4_ANOAL
MLRARRAVVQLVVSIYAAVVYANNLSMILIMISHSNGLLSQNLPCAAILACSSAYFSYSWGRASVKATTARIPSSRIANENFILDASRYYCTTI